MHFLIKSLSFLDLYSSYCRTTKALLNRFSLTALGALNNDTIGGRKIGPCMSFDCNRLGADHPIPAMTLMSYN